MYRLFGIGEGVTYSEKSLLKYGEINEEHLAKGKVTIGLTGSETAVIDVHSE